MIKEIVLDNTSVKYQITFKKNKNTYFYFKRKGYIQINASKYQKEKEILKFMKKNSESFVKKFNRSLVLNLTDDAYRIWGIEYRITRDIENKNIVIDHNLLEVKEPDLAIDQLDNFYKIIEKEIIMSEAKKLKMKYLNNGLIDISDIIIKTRYTTSRFGSCNYRLKTINLNLKLVHYDKQFIEYVFLHEIAHLIHQNHSKDFYLLLSKLCPSYKELKKELNRKFKR